jgi:hypothetical protein
MLRRKNHDRELSLYRRAAVEPARLFPPDASVGVDLDKGRPALAPIDVVSKGKVTSMIGVTLEEEGRAAGRGRTRRLKPSAHAC